MPIGTGGSFSPSTAAEWYPGACVLVRVADSLEHQRSPRLLENRRGDLVGLEMERRQAKPRRAQRVGGGRVRGRQEQVCGLGIATFNRGEDGLEHPCDRLTGGHLDPPHPHHPPPPRTFCLPPPAPPTRR